MYNFKFSFFLSFFLSFCFLTDATSQITHYVNVKLWIGQDSQGNRLDPTIVTSSKDYCEEAYGHHGIGFNWCEEILVDDDLFHNTPVPFLTEGNCTIEFDPNFIHIYLVEDCPPSCGGTTGQANGIPGNRAYSEPNGTLAHELAHLLDLEHFGGCPSDLPSDWKVGDPLGVDDARDFVLDTPIVPRHETEENSSTIVWPIYQVDDPATLEDEGCWVDWAQSVGLCSDENGFETFPPNYGYQLDVNGNMFYEPIWETNVMSGFNSGDCRGFVRNFTDGQGDRMIEKLNGSHSIYVDNFQTECPNRTFTSPLLTQSILNSGDILTGKWRVEQNLIVDSEVIFRGATIFVGRGLGIAVTNSGKLVAEQSIFDVHFTCGDKWNGISVDPDGEISMTDVDINKAHIGIDLSSTEIDLNFVTFFACNIGMDIHYNSTQDNIILTDCNFIESKILITDSTVKFDVIRCHRSDLFSTSTTGAHRLFISIGAGAGRPTFLDSELKVENLDFFGLANCYFDAFADVIVDSGNRVDICWSLFDDNVSNPSIDMSSREAIGGVNNYKIYGNQFINDQNELGILAGSISTDQSVIRNNIFSGAISPNNFDSGLDNFVEISCNYCKTEIGVPFKTASGMQDQGREDHPAGNKFFFSKAIDALTEFDYYYNEFDPALEQPANNIKVKSIQSRYLDESVCLSEQEILDQGLWEPFFENMCSLESGLWNYDSSEIACYCPAPPNPGPTPVNPIDPNPNPGSGHSGNSGMIAQQGINHTFDDFDGEIINVNTIGNNVIIERANNTNKVLEICEIRLLNVNGQVLINKVSSQNKFDLNISSLPNGIYILNIVGATSEVSNNTIIYHQE